MYMHLANFALNKMLLNMWVMFNTSLFILCFLSDVVKRLLESPWPQLLEPGKDDSYDTSV